MASPIVSTITGYVEEHRTELISKAVLIGRTANYLNLMTGVVGPTTLNLYDTTVVLQDGSTCGFTDSGSTTLSQRVLTPAILKSNMTYCPKNLLKTYAQHLVKVGAGKETLPFEEKFVSSIADGVSEAIENMIWQGQSGQTNQFEGFLSILSAATNSVKVNEASGTTAAQAIEDTYMAIPAQIVEKEDTVIFVGEEIFREYIQSLVKANMYHYDATYGEGVYKVPGSNIRVIAVNGLNNTHKIVAGQLKNMFYGVDMENDSETFDVWYSKDDDVWKVNVSFSSGVQVAYPQEVVLTTIATA